MRCGIGVNEFWDLTPVEAVTAVQARAEQQQERDLALAWHVAALQRTKKLPSLKRLLHPPQTKVLEGEELDRRAAEFEEMKRRFGVEG